MLEAIQTTDDVFGVNRDLPLNYVSREEVDQKFIDSLARHQHIVIYGSSKQGKTSLRKHCLNDTDYIVVACQNKWSLAELHSAILKECGFSIRQSSEKSVSGKHKVVAELEAKAKIPFFTEGGGKASYEYENDKQTVDFYKPLELDAEDTNDIIRAISEIDFKKYIVLEDFHYLPDETQKDFSFALKTFHEKSKISFIIVGVWREENRLIGFNGDLTDRVLSVDVDTWNTESQREVILEGGKLLNVDFDQKFIEQLLERCFDSVHIVQEACRRACREAHVTETKEEIVSVGANQDTAALVSLVVEEQAARYRGFLQRFADGFQETDLQMPKWIIYSILCSSVDQLEKGVRLRRISKLIKKAHVRGNDLNNGNITQALNSSTSLQNKKGVRPLIIDYDPANTSLHVVDKGFLIWLSSQNIAELLEDLELPDIVEIEETGL
ncbi:hypothetical protein [Novosphingobium pentaromativorans]|uniref:Uncharacterized protein n=1 Tax=Novosphingobium pentaromativorans US6-1 TaxID=1088721 RepID=G6E972_9SPHN|nr:hypothetical protein [Novosphingobium pentaromativorans]AIT81111.1 hypothetical protein JI59_15635 [Novosphingobium pentaromativorans US6-1]EHJ62296.1 hypothetical protein NSU_0893 [Novosphingobium pentaromativorans US6-1]